jgi:hypothetical protein
MQSDGSVIWTSVDCGSLLPLCAHNLLWHKVAPPRIQVYQERQQAGFRTSGSGLPQSTTIAELRSAGPKTEKGG